MKVIAQNNKVYNTTELGMRGTTIVAWIDSHKEVELGTYKSTARTIEVFSKMSCLGWNTQGAEYVMPKD